MPLYIEILDQDSSATVSELADGTDARILDRWTTENAGETVRLVETPDTQESPRATARGMRILFY